MKEGDYLVWTEMIYSKQDVDKKTPIASHHDLTDKREMLIPTIEKPIVPTSLPVEKFADTGMNITIGATVTGAIGLLLYLYYFFKKKRDVK